MNYLSKTLAIYFAALTFFVGVGGYFVPQFSTRLVGQSNEQELFLAQQQTSGFFILQSKDTGTILPVWQKVSKIPGLTLFFENPPVAKPLLFSRRKISIADINSFKASYAYLLYPFHEFS